MYRKEEKQREADAEIGGSPQGKSCPVYHFAGYDNGIQSE